MEDVRQFFERYKQARHDVYLADAEQRRILRLQFFANREGRPLEQESLGKLLDEEITDLKEVGDRVEITTSGCDVNGPRHYLLCKSDDGWRIEKLFLKCLTCRDKEEPSKACEMCNGTGLFEFTE